MSGIGTNYSQFYKGSQQIKGYGSGNGQKDTVVRYQFNTTDEKGNKIMDKMSKEETMRAVNEISSMYGDNVIVEFSGDGMAALADHKLMMDFPEEHKEIPEDMLVQLEGPEPLTEEQLAKMNEKHGDDTEALMKVYDPEAYEEMKKIEKEGLATGTKEGMVAGFRYMWKWMSDKAKTDPGWIDKAKSEIKASESNPQSSEPKLSDKAKKYLDSLRKQYGDFDFIVGNKGDDLKGLLKQSNKEFSVVFSSDELEKMANDEKYAAEKMRRVQTIVHMTDRICQEFGYERAWDQRGTENSNGVISKMAVSFDEDGKMNIFAELEKSSEKQREHIEKMREKKADDKKAAEKKAEKEKEAERQKHSEPVKRIQIEAESEDDLYKKISEIDWDK